MMMICYNQSPKSILNLIRNCKIGKWIPLIVLVDCEDEREHEKEKMEPTLEGEEQMKKDTGLNIKTS